jgi:hypothetical protein
MLHSGAVTLSRSVCSRREAAARRQQRSACACSASTEPEERFLAEVVYALISSHSVGVPAGHVLPKFQSRLTAEAYTSVLVALGRKEMWEPAAAVARWCREQGPLLPASAYVLVSQRRLEDGHWDAALEPLAWMRDLGCEPSGEAVEAIARLSVEGELRMTRRAELRELVSWVRTRDAGRALWSVYATAAPSGGAVAATWRSDGLAFDSKASADELLRGPLDSLCERLAVEGTL